MLRDFSTGSQSRARAFYLRCPCVLMPPSQFPVRGVWLMRSHLQGPNGEDWDQYLTNTIKNYRIIYLSSSGPANYEKDMTMQYCEILTSSFRHPALRV